MFEITEHTADLGLRIQTRRLNDLFADAGQGLLAVLMVNPESVRRVEEVTLELEAEQLDFLLFDWLTELLYTFETSGMLLSEFDVRVSGNRLQATCRGEKLDRARHDLDHEVKAVTYHQLSVVETPDGWVAEVILDI